MTPETRCNKIKEPSPPQKKKKKKHVACVFSFWAQALRRLLFWVALGAEGCLVVSRRGEAGGAEAAGHLRARPAEAAEAAKRREAAPQGKTDTFGAFCPGLWGLLTF